MNLKVSAVLVVVFATVFIVGCSARVAQEQAPSIIPTTPTSGKKPASPVIHPAFRNAGKVKGTEVWRIENFEPVLVQASNQGKFHTGDSYIVLRTNESPKKVLSWDAHFWLGLETTQDESGAAAILTVQLDDQLGGAAVQHREVQNEESTLFKGYFNNRINYQPGGVASGFKKVTTNAAGEQRLFQIKGKKNIRTRQVEKSVAAMNKGDCFILDAGREVYVYVGPTARRVEKLKAISVANQIRDQDHNGRATVQIVDEFSSASDQQHFFDVLGSGSPAGVPADTTAEEDSAFEANDERRVTLYKVSDAGGSVRVEPITQKPLKQEMFVSTDCFILDTGSGLYAWIGKRASATEKSQAVPKAQELISTKKYPAWTEVKRVAEGTESTSFKQYFLTWQDHGMSHTRLI